MTNEFYRRLLGEWMPRAEGGYVRAKVTGSHQNDRETLFGVTDAVWLAHLRGMPDAEVAQLSPGVARHVREIQANPTLGEVHDLLRAVARNLTPFGGGQHPDGQPARAQGIDLPNRNAAQRADLATMRRLTADILMEDYVVNPGFDAFPPAIAAHLVDFGVNKGNARARWALAEALHDTGHLPDAAYRRMPHLSLTQVVDPNRTVFASGPGAWFARESTSDALLAYTQDLSPAEQRQLVARFNHHRVAYNNHRGEIEPGFAQFVPGLNARVERLETWLENEGVAAAPPARRAAPAAPMRAAPSPAPVRPSTPPHAPAGETLQLEVQFRVTRGNHGGGTMLLDDAIAIEIPGRGTVTYAVNRDGRFVDHGTLPPGVQLLGRIDSGSHLPPGNVANPFPQERTLTWLDSHGHRQYLPLSGDMNRAIREADIAYVPLVNQRTGIGSVGDFARDATGLQFSESDRLFIEQTRNGPRYSVIDTDRTTSGQHPRYSVQTPAVSEHHPATPRR